MPQTVRRHHPYLSDPIPEARLVESSEPEDDGLAPQERIDRALAEQQEVKSLLGRFEAILWLAATVFLWKYLDMAEAIADGGFKQPAMGIAIFLVAVVFGIGAYFYLYVSLYLGSDVEPMKHSPRLIYTSTAAMFLSIFALLRGLWPVFRLWSPVLVFLGIMDSIMVVQFLPSRGKKTAAPAAASASVDAPEPLATAGKDD
jgi:hypothetical protein